MIDQMRAGESVSDVMDYFLGLGMVRGALAARRGADGVRLGGAAWLVTARR